MAKAAELRRGGPGDLDWIGQVHHDLYVVTGMYDPVFDAYVAKGFPPFEQHYDEDLDRIWLAEQAGHRVGAIAIQHSMDRPGWAQLRWFFVLPSARGTGTGGRLLREAVAFCREARYKGIYLWTMEGLPAARHVYEEAGFRLRETAPAPWHRALLQQRFELAF